MNRLSNYLFFGFLLLIIAYHLFTLEIQPLPWFDEVYFASIADNFISNGSFVPEIASYARNGRPALTYGPVYFFLTGLSMKLFGFGIGQFRIIALLSGLLCVRLTYSIVKSQVPAESWKYKILIISILTDPFFSLAFHQGRMDLTALCFCLVAIFYFLKGGNNNVLVSGIAGVLSLLTTPRAIVVLWPLFIFLLIDIYKNKQFKKAFLWALPFLLIYPVWIYVGFGGFGGFVNYYLTINGVTNSANGQYIGPNLYIPQHEYCLIFVGLAALIYGLTKQGKAYFNPLVIISLIVIISFYLIVLDWGPYSSFIIPFYYILIFYSWSLIPSIKGLKVLYSLPVLFLLIFNLTYSVVKADQVLASRKVRDPQLADSFVRDNIPPGSKVVGDALYYYSVKKNGSEFQLFDQYDTLESRERKHRLDFKYNFLIASEVMKPKNAEIIEYYIKMGDLEKVAIFRSEMTKNGNREILSNLEKAGYSGSVYLRK
ncbi:MAG: glycosyltransferase family 39 protein [Sporocytophaga sp.]|uniref:ArnT family glycosyltransferase n=1 Tax=Sporocytophaga sp. TaxID=2231183 RepID=UPI001B1A1487|nr:glycosyltransferase family 39 protein [Sporocytophaga sp.]MBO9698813.1 glycosyltransferase family 39 protein [Sporocytophaga sp.]